MPCITHWVNCINIFLVLYAASASFQTYCMELMISIGDVTGNFTCRSALSGWSVSPLQEYWVIPCSYGHLDGINRTIWLFYFARWKCSTELLVLAWNAALGISTAKLSSYILGSLYTRALPLPEVLKWYILCETRGEVSALVEYVKDVIGITMKLVTYKECELSHLIFFICNNVVSRKTRGCLTVYEIHCGVTLSLGSMVFLCCNYHNVRPSFLYYCPSSPIFHVFLQPFWKLSWPVFG